MVSAYDVKKLLRNIVSKKSIGMGKIEPKLNFQANYWPLQLITVLIKERFQIMLK